MAYFEIVQYLKSKADSEIAAGQRTFKSRKGKYGEDIEFLGLRVPFVRQTVKQYRDVPLGTAQRLLRSKYHEVRLFALLLLVSQFERGDSAARKSVYTLYLENTRYINNWDLVDCSAYQIVGSWLEKRAKAPLLQLARSSVLWERRIAMVATFQCIRANNFSPTLRIATILLNDEEDLIHKAVGWMLREVGNRDRQVLVDYLQERYHSMPRTMLRYAIEKFPARERKRYLEGKI